MPFDSTLNGAQLYSLARLVGQTASLLQLTGTADSLNRISAEISSLKRAGMLGRREATFLSRFVAREDESPRRAVVELLSRIEGRVLGGLVRSGGVPGNSHRRIEDRLEGQGAIIPSTIIDADRRIRSAWIDEFLGARGIRSIGHPRHVRETSLVRLEELSRLLNRPVFAKLEGEQPGGSFKNRGATNFLIHALLAGRDPAQTRIFTASQGNHVLGVMRAARNLGFSNVEAFLPMGASRRKASWIEGHGGRVEWFGNCLEEAEDEARRRVQGDPDALYLPAFDHPLVIAGQATVGLELSRQMAQWGRRWEPDRYSVIAPVGGGGLVSGLAALLSPHGIPVFGAISDTHPHPFRSYNERRIVVPEKFRPVDAVADGAASQRMGRAGFASILQYVTGMAVIRDHEVAAALTFLWEQGVAAEGAAALPVASLLFGGLQLGRFSIPPTRPVVMILTGRNVDPERRTAIQAQVGHGQSGGTWHKIHSEYQRLLKNLADEGFLVDGQVRNLVSPEDAIGFVDCVVKYLPHGWDFIEAMSRLHFGPWRAEGHKDLNATLRSFGEFHLRGEGSKGWTLVHPLNQRATALVGAIDLVKMGITTWPEAVEKYKLLEIIPRLEVETYIVDLYLQRPEWIRMLYPKKDSKGLEDIRKRIQLDNERTKGAIRKALVTVQRTVG